MFESIRWKFSSAFGLVSAALLALSNQQLALAPGFRVLVIMLFVSATVAGLVIQIRLYALMTNMWQKLVALQNIENTLVKGHSPENERAIWCTTDLTFVASPRRRRFFILCTTVHSMLCLLFATLIGAAIGMIFFAKTIFSLQLCSSIGFTILFWFSALYLSALYSRRINQGFELSTPFSSN